MKDILNHLNIAQKSASVKLKKKSPSPNIGITLRGEPLKTLDSDFELLL
jgi:hypothetical protein